MTDIIWSSPVLRSAEHFSSRAHDDGHLLRGVVVIPVDDLPAHLTYEVHVTPDWRTRRVEALVELAERSRRIEITADGAGRWRHNGRSADDLDGCIDVDLGWTPATNTLPIRRLALEVGQSRSLDVAWLRFPELTLQRVSQTYERLDLTTWRYRSGSFTADLDVDENGYVLRYGPDIWIAVAHSV